MAKVSALKVWIWTKILLLVLLALYLLTFLYRNSQEVDLWLFPGIDFPRTNLVLALIGAFAVGSLLTVLVRTILRTLRQIRESRQRDRTERLEREIAEMRTKSTSLQTRE